MRKILTSSAIVVTGALAVTGAGVALAAWTSQGSGSAAASTPKAKAALTVTPATLAADSIYPTASFSNSVTVTNSNPYAVKLSGVEVTGATSTDTACQTALTALATSPFSGTQANTTKLNNANPSTSVTVTVTVGNSIPDECAAAPITIAFRASGASDNQ